MWKTGVACVLLAALSFATMPARAAVPPADDPPLVELAVAGDAGGAELVAARVESWFQGQVRVARSASAAPRAAPGPADHAGIRVWIALEGPTAARVLFAVQRSPAQPPRYLVSDVPVDEGFDELGVERLGQIVYLSAMALWEGNVGSSPAEVEQWLRWRPNAAPRHEEPAHPGRWMLRVGAEYVASVAGDEGVGQSVGAHVAALHERGAYRLGARLRAAVLVPREVTSSGVTLGLRGTSFALGAALDGKVGARLWIPAELGLALDVVRYRTDAINDPTYRADAGGTDVRPVAYSRCGISVDVGGVSLGVAALIDIDLVHAHYDLSDNGHRSAVLTPWIVRPGISAGASW
jgi:hypothetical protein